MFLRIKRANMKNVKFRESYNEEIQKLVSRVIEKEKQEKVNPFITERVMNKIEEKGNAHPVIIIPRILRLSVITACFILTILAGISLGKLYNQPEMLNDFISINDAYLENIELFISE